MKNELSLVIKNEILPIHIASTNNRLTIIDVTLCTENLTDEFEWTVLDDVHGSDHFPILLTFNQSRHDLINKIMLRKCRKRPLNLNLNFQKPLNFAWKMLNKLNISF